MHHNQENAIQKFKPQGKEKNSTSYICTRGSDIK